MKRHPTILFLIAALMIAALGFGWDLHRKEARKSWPYRQIGNAVELGAALSIYRENRGVYPNRLEDLVALGIVNQQTFDRLRFQVAPDANYEPWLYKTPAGIGEIAIVAPRAVYPWAGHSGWRVTARADGGAELVSDTKLDRLPKWVAK